MKLESKSRKQNFLAAVLLVAACAQPALAGYKAALSTTGVGRVQASLRYTTISDAITPDSFPRPSAGVTDRGTWTVRVPQPSGTPLVCTSTVSTVFLTGGWKALARSWVVTGVTADNPELKEKLAQEQFTLTPAFCGAGYDIASGEEIIDGKRYCVVLGKATAGTAAWFRGYTMDREPTSWEDLKENGTKLYEALVKGPFDFGEIESPDRCKAMKVPIDYDGPNLFLVSDALAESATELQFIDCPEVVTIGCSDPLVYPTLQTIGGCGDVSVAYYPSIDDLPPTGASIVTAVATDAVENVATCQFVVNRPPIEFRGKPLVRTPFDGDCTLPVRLTRAGSKVPLKFVTTACGALYKSSVTPTVTITKVDPATCAVIAIPVNQEQFQWVSNQWQFEWNTLVTDKGRFKVEVFLGDGGTNPYAFVELR